MKNYLKILLTSFLLTVFIFRVSGYEVTGLLIDSVSMSPVEFATVYVNGTTIGTTSDLNGKFKLSFDMENCEIVINHLSYESVLINFQSETNIHLLIKLKPKNIMISQVSVESVNLRTANMTYFKKEFLGNDEWGRNATIRNDSVIFFNVEYYDEKPSDKSLKNEMKYFEVKTTAPLIIHLPKLGYNLEYDLVKFIEDYDEEFGVRIIKNLGYSYFKEIAPSSVRVQKILNNNRQEVYHHSTMHFLRSLYTKTLKENGYETYEIIQNESSGLPEYKEYDLTSGNCLNYTSNEAQLTGLKGKKIRIRYYSYGTEPYNLLETKKYSYTVISSNIFFLKDTCTIRENGSLPGGEMLFEGGIVNKRMGAALPSDITFNSIAK